MSDTKILQALLDGQKSMMQKLDALEKGQDKLRQDLTTRIDKLGLQLARLEDDTPTTGEFDALEKRVRRLERNLTSSQ